MKINFFSFDSAPTHLKIQWRDAISEVLESDQFIGGRIVSKFENEWSQYLDIKHTIGVGNGYDALVIALKTLDIGPGDLVAVPSHTFIATWLAVASVGAQPIGIDCDTHGLMDIDLLEKQETTFSAVIPVHMHGQMVDMQRLIKWARDRKVLVIEDCAQAHGAELKGKKSGTWGDIGAFSFYPTKNLGAIGDAGALVTNNYKYAERARSIANYGSTKNDKYEYQHMGINSRLDPIQAAILSVNLKYLDSWNVARKLVAEKYSSGLAKIGIKPFTTTPESVFHHYIAISENRVKTASLLEEHGILTSVHYPKSAENNFQIIQGLNVNLNSPKSFNLATKTLSLPLSPWIKESEINYILEKISLDSIRRSFFGEI
jgi:dTDP-4-amino-4,6-dideoxygalactose transaminase